MTIIKPSGKFRGWDVIDQDRRHLEPDELVRLFDVLKEDPFWYGYFRLQYYFGCRVSEIALVLKEDVSFEQKMILIRRLKKKRRPTIVEEYVDDAGKTRKRRRQDESVEPGPGFTECVYGLPDKLIELLRGVERYQRSARVPVENPWFFASKTRPGPKTAEIKERVAMLRRVADGWRAVSRATADYRFRDAALAAGIGRQLASTHVLRHTRATLMLAAGVPAEDVRFLLGHSSIETTRRYLGVAKTLRLRAQTSAELGLGDLS